jgi:hypothetical protein
MAKFVLKSAGVYYKDNTTRVYSITQNKEEATVFNTYARAYRVGAELNGKWQIEKL